MTNVPVATVDTHAYGLFGQVAYRFSDKWRAKAGVRQSYDERELDLVQTLSDPGGVLGPAGVTVLRQNESKDWQATTPEFGLEYAPEDNRLYYATASRGYKAGGYNTSSVQPAFDPEYLWAYEIGVKASFPDPALRMNAAVFHYDYDDMQLDSLPVCAPAGTYPIVINAGQATLQGADIEVLFRPRWNVELSTGATALFTAKFDEIVNMPVQRN